MKAPTHEGADLLALTRDGLVPTRLEETNHFRLMREFCGDPRAFVQTMLG